MQVLISGGIKTKNILDVVKSRFSSGVDFTVENNISNIGNYFSRGNYFDRAIILEQSWTEDDTIQDEIEIRDNLHQFIMAVKDRFRTFEVIFVVTSTPEMAKLVLEESLDIMAYSKVLLKTPPYYASFFTTLIANEINKMPDKYVFDMARVVELVKDGEPATNITWSTGHKEEDTTLSGPLLESAVDTDLNMGMRDMEDDIEEESMDNSDVNDEMFGDTGEQFESDFDFDGLNGMTDDDESDSFGSLYDFDEDEDNQPETDFTAFDDFSDSIDTTNNTDVEFSDTFETEEDTKTEDESSTSDKFSGFGGSNLDIDTEASFDNFDFDSVGVYGSGFEEAPLDTTEQTWNEPVKTEEKTWDEPVNTQEEANITGLFNGDNGFNSQIEQTEKTDNVDKAADNLFNDNYYEDDEDHTDEIPIDYGIDFKGIKGKGTKAKTRFKAPLNTKRAVEDNSDLHIVLKTFLKRGNALTVTGGRCSGKTLVASNLANLISKLGYTVLLVDMDTKWRGISYIAKDVYDTVHAGDTSKAALRRAINSNNAEIGRHVDIIRPGFHVLTTGLGCDMEPVGEVIQPIKINRFIHNAKTAYNFIIFDVPFEDLTTSLADVLFATDDLIMCVDATNHGLMEFLLNMGNVESDDVKSTLFSISQILFNKVEKVENVFGYKVKTVRQVLKALDMQMAELIGGEAEYLFKDLKICGVMKYSQLYEKYWFSKYQISDFADGEHIFLDILRKVLVKN